MLLSTLCIHLLPAVSEVIKIGFFQTLEFKVGKDFMTSKECRYVTCESSSPCTFPFFTGAYRAFISAVRVDDFTSAEGKAYKNKPQGILLKNGETKDEFIQRLPEKVESLIRDGEVRVARNMLCIPDKFSRKKAGGEDSECGSITASPEPEIEEAP